MQVLLQGEETGQPESAPRNLEPAAAELALQRHWKATKKQLRLSKPQANVARYCFNQSHIINRQQVTEVALSQFND